MRIGEVIETSTVGFWAESTALHELPPLGALVAVGLPDGTILYGVVAFGQTAGLDAGRRAIRRGDEHTVDSAIYDRHPELRRILRTTFRAVTVGYSSADGRPRHHLPPCPPPLHYSVARPDHAALLAFTDVPRYLAILAGAEGEVAPEQLLAAHIRCVYTDRGSDAIWLAAAGRGVARLLKRDYDRLLTVLEAIDPGASDERGRPLGRTSDEGRIIPIEPRANGHQDVPF